MTRKQIADLTQEEIDGLTDEEFVRVARGQDPGPASKVDLSAGRTPERDVAEIERRLLQRSGPTADLSGGRPAGREPSDEELLQGKRDLLDGTHARRVSQRRAIESQAEDLGWSLRARRRGEIISHDHEALLRELGIV